MTWWIYLVLFVCFLFVYGFAYRQGQKDEAAIAEEYLRRERLR